jgi:hypothetical protein
MRRSLSILLLLAVACASNQASRPAGIAQPDLDARMVNPLFFGSGTEAHATIEVAIQNRASAPIIVRRIELDSPGMSQYSLLRSVRDYRETIPAGETKTLTMVEFESSAGEVWREILMLR